MILNEKKLIVIVGPTAVGKTSLSIELAKRLNCEIISADSRQFYKEISIGTAKPSDFELNQVKHHFINNLSISDNYSAGKFEIEALKCISTLFRTNENVIVVGGSGMYIDAICKGIDNIPSDKKVREKLNSQYNEFGIHSLQQELKEKDPLHFSTMDIHNPQRLIRALEVCRVSGKTYSSFRKMTTKKRAFTIKKIGINSDKEILHNRIEKRVDQMLRDGLLEEIDLVFSKKDLNPLNTVGYKELFKYKSGDLTLNQAVDEIKKNTKKFAKRQMTWFKRDPSIKWFKKEEIKHILDYVDSKP